MIKRLDLRARLSRLAPWLVAGGAYWWLRPSPLTQVEILGAVMPPSPLGWSHAPMDGQAERVFLGLFVLAGLVFFLLGGRRYGQPSFAATWSAALLSLGTALFSSFPLRHDWIIAVAASLAEQTRGGMDVTHAAMLIGAGGLTLLVFLLALILHPMFIPYRPPSGGLWLGDGDIAWGSVRGVRPSDTFADRGIPSGKP